MAGCIGLSPCRMPTIGGEVHQAEANISVKIIHFLYLLHSHRDQFPLYSTCYYQQTDGRVHPSEKETKKTVACLHF